MLDRVTKDLRKMFKKNAEKKGLVSSEFLWELYGHRASDWDDEHDGPSEQDEVVDETYLKMLYGKTGMMGLRYVLDVPEAVFREFNNDEDAIQEAIFNSIYDLVNVSIKHVDNEPVADLEGDFRWRNQKLWNFDFSVEDQANWPDHLSYLCDEPVNRA